MATRIDSASRLIPASPEFVYKAFAAPGAMEQWIPPNNMTGKMLHFDFREGGSGKPFREGEKIKVGSR